MATGGALIGLLALGGARDVMAQIKSGDKPEASEIWQKVRASLFENRPIANAGDDQLSLDAPARAEDAAVVPIAMRARLPHTAATYVSKLYLVIDNNPSPIAAIFSFTPQSGRADIETRVRVDEYTFVRAIAEPAMAACCCAPASSGVRRLLGAARQGPPGGIGHAGQDATARGRRCGARQAHAGPADDQPPERLGHGDEPADAPVHPAPLRALGQRGLRRPARAVGRPRFRDQREPEWLSSCPGPGQLIAKWVDTPSPH